MNRDWEEYSIACEVIGDIRDRLREGAEGTGATLSADECRKMLLCLKPPPKPASREPQFNSVAIMWCCTLFQALDKMSPSDAVAATAERFNCSKWVVNKALRGK